jgi:acetoacetyl-CoA synthetase
MQDEPLWKPSPARAAVTQMMDFLRRVNARHGLDLADSRALHAWSVAHPALFWDEVWDYCGVIGDKGSSTGARLLIDGERMPGAQFFPDATLNFAENLLRGCPSTTCAGSSRAPSRRWRPPAWARATALPPCCRTCPNRWR